MNTKFSASLNQVRQGASPSPKESPSDSTSIPEPQIVSLPEAPVADLSMSPCSQPTVFTSQELSMQTDPTPSPEPLPPTRSGLFSKLSAKVKTFIKSL